MPSHGLVLLIGGFFGAFARWPSWLANIGVFLLLVAVGSNSGRKQAPIIGGVTLLTALSFLQNYGAEMMSAQGGRVLPIVQFGPGYWLWVSSIVVLFLHSLNVARRPPGPEDDADDF